MFCSNCGTPLSDDALFCPECGTRVGSDAPVQPAAQYQPAAPYQAAPQAQPSYQPAASGSPFAPPTQTAAPVQPNPAAPMSQQDMRQIWEQEAKQTWKQDAEDWQRTHSEQVTAAILTKKKRAKGLWIGLGILLLAALIAGGIWFLNRNKASDSPLEKLTEPAQNSYSALSDYLEELPNLHAILKNLDALQDAGSLRLALDMNVDSDSLPIGINLDLLRDKNSQRALLQGKIQVKDMEIPLSLYLDPQQLQLSLPGLLRENEVLALPLEDLPARWNASALAELLDVELPEDFDLSSLAESDVEKSLKELYGEDWTKFYDSVKVVPYEGKSRFEGGGETLTLSWDKEALKAMIDKTELEDELPDVNGVDDLSSIDLDALSAKAIVSVLGQLGEQIRETQFYKENDMLTAFWLELGDEQSGLTQTEIRLTGENNPWERITIAVTRQDDGSSSSSNAEILLRKAEGKLRIEFSAVRDDGEPESAAIVYNDADGRISAEGPDVPEEMPELCLLPAENGCSLKFRMDSFDSKSDVNITIGRGSGPIQPISAEPKDLLSMSETQLQGLLMRIVSKIQNIAQDE